MSLTPARLRELLSFDQGTGVFRWRVRRGPSAPAGALAGSVGVNGYRHICIDQKEYLAHRLAHFWAHGEWPPENIDHRTGAKASAEMGELRTCTQSQNGMNRGRQRNNTSGFKGVSFNKNAGRWVANICAQGRSRYLGLYERPEEAHEVYCLAADMLHGEFAHYGDSPLQ